MLLNNRKKELISDSLDCFVQNGLLNTTMTVLVKHLNIPRGLLYYYFDSKDDLVISCASEAAKRLENQLMEVVIQHISNPAMMKRKLQNIADQQAPMMRFFVSVAVSEHFGHKIKPALADFAGRYDFYASKVAEKLQCDVEEIRPVVYMMILSITNYMIFREEKLFNPQLDAVVSKYSAYQAKANAKT